MKHIVTGQDNIFGPWLMKKTQGEWHNDRGHTIGLFDDEKGPVAACMYEGYNEASVVMHCAGEGKDWLNREFLWFVFFYPFEQLKIKKIISPVESYNEDCIKFITHIGFSLEATLKDASPKGDLLLFTLISENCKWLSLKEKYRGKTQSTQTT